jgi:heat shock protein HtpX
MVTMTLLQGVLNTFVIVASRALGFLIDSALNRSEEGERRGPGMGYYLIRFVLELVLGVLASLVVAWFSRQREFRADRGAAELLGQPHTMIGALARLGQLEAGVLPSSMAAMGIQGGLGRLFSTHPPIEERIAALQAR